MPTPGHQIMPTRPLELLKSKFGKDAGLLEYIPVDRIEMVQHEDNFGGFLSHKIRLGTMHAGNADWTVWVYLYASASFKKHASIMKTFAIHPHNSTNRVSVTGSEVLRKVALRDEFRPVSSNHHVLAVLLKTCFLLKDGEFPQGFFFTDGFIDNLLCACRKYKGDGEYGHKAKSVEPTPNAGGARSCSYPLRTGIRKSEQHARRDQSFNELNPASHHIAPRRNPASGHEYNKSQDPRPHREQNSAHSEGVLIDDEDVIIRPHKSAHDLMRKAAYSPLVFSMAPPATYITSQPSASVGIPSPEAAVSHLAQAIPNHDQHNVLLPRPSSIPTIPVAAPAIDEYILLHNQKEDIDSELKELDEGLKTVDDEYYGRRKTLANYIDKELPAIHKAQIHDMVDALSIKQNEETLKLRAEYAALKVEQAEKRKALQEQQKVKTRRKENLDTAVGRQRQSMTKEQLLSFLDHYTVQHSASKRTKVDRNEAEVDEQD